MRKHPIVIALGIAGIIAGMQAGIAAINNESTVAAPAAVQAEPQAVVDTQTPLEPNTTAATGASSVPLAQAPGEGILQPKWMLTPSSEPKLTAAAQDDEYYVRVPFTNKRIKVSNPTFPRNSSEFPDTAPSVVAYFDNKNANTALTGAPGPVFPGSSDEISQPLPSTLAYFDRLEARKLAASQPAPTPVAVAPAEVPTGAVVATTASGAGN